MNASLRVVRVCVYVCVCIWIYEKSVSLIIGTHMCALALIYSLKAPRGNNKCDRTI